MTPRRLAVLAVKLLVTAALIAWIVHKVDWPVFRDTLATLPVWVLLVTVGVWFICSVISAVKWHQLLMVHGLCYRLRTLIHWYLVGQFLSQFLPSMVGGDGYRIYKTLGNGRHRACAVLAVFVERASGMAALCVMGTAAAALDWFATGNTFSRAVMAVAGSAWLLAFAALGIAWLTGMLPRLTRHRRCPSAVRSLVLYASEYARHPARVFLAGVISFLFHGLRVFAYWFLLWGMGLTAGVPGLVVVAMLVTVVGMLPISLGGWGLVDGSFMLVAKYYGVPAEAGLTVMLLTRATVLPVALVGGLMYLMNHDAVPQRNESSSAALPGLV